ncbi:MAG: S24/S26 family peptidase [Acidimicrobiales bacterium]
MSRRAKERSDRPKGWWRRFGSLIVYYALPVIVVLAAGGYTYAALVMHVNPPVVAVQGTSMLPTLKNGELVVLAPVDAKTLKTGEVIAVRVPTQVRVTYNVPATVVQRIVRVEHTSKGLLFITRDGRRSSGVVFTTGSRDVVGRFKFAVPVLGYVLRFVQSIEGVVFFVAVVVIWLLYYLFGVIDDRRRNAREAASNERAALVDAQGARTALPVEPVVASVGTPHPVSNQAPVVIKESVAPTVAPALKPGNPAVVSAGFLKEPVVRANSSTWASLVVNAGVEEAKKSKKAKKGVESSPNARAHESFEGTKKVKKEKKKNKKVKNGNKKEKRPNKK